MARPTKYKKIYAKRAKDHLAQGNSVRSLAALFEVTESTIHEWRKHFTEFSDNINIGQSMSHQFYIDKAKGLIDGNKGSEKTLFFMMKNILKYSDNPVVDEKEQQQPVFNFFTNPPKKDDEEE